MTITKVKIYNYDKNYKIENKLSNNFMCMADIDIDYDIRVKYIKLFNGNKGEYLEFPINVKNIFIHHPITEEARELILSTVLNEYNKIIKQKGKI